MIAAAMGAIALSGCEEKYDPIVALEPKEKQEVTLSKSCITSTGATKPS